MFNPEQFSEHVIEPALKQIGLYSKGAEQLLLGTCCVESHLGTYLHQINGPALGVFQMEPATHKDIWANYLRYRRDLRSTIKDFVPECMWDVEEKHPHHDLLIYDMRYAAMMARVKYRRSSLPIPPSDSWGQFATVWKQVYNTMHGAGTVFKFMESLVSCKVIRAQ